MLQEKIYHFLFDRYAYMETRNEMRNIINVENFLQLYQGVKSVCMCVTNRCGNKRDR